MKRSYKLLTALKLKNYTEKNFVVLHDILDSDFTMDLDLLSVLENGSYRIDRDDDCDKDLSFLEFITVYFKKIAIFLAWVPKENVPLYLHKKEIKPFVEWRLLINK